MGNVVLLHHPQRFHNGRHSGLVIGAQNGVAGAADDAVLHHRPDALTGLHCVHVGTQTDGLTGAGGGQGGDDVAHLAAEGLAGLVHDHLKAQLCQLGHQKAGYISLLTAQTVDLYIFQKAVNQTLFIDHDKSLSFLSIIASAPPPVNAYRPCPCRKKLL